MVTEVADGYLCHTEVAVGHASWHTFYSCTGSISYVNDKRGAKINDDNNLYSMKVAVMDYPCPHEGWYLCSTMVAVVHVKNTVANMNDLLSYTSPEPLFASFYMLPKIYSFL